MTHGVVIDIAVPVVILRIARFSDVRVRRQKHARDGILHPAVHVIQPHVAQRSLPGVALTGDRGADGQINAAGRTTPRSRVPAITIGSKVLIHQRASICIQDTRRTVLLIFQQVIGFAPPNVSSKAIIAQKMITMKNSDAI